MGGRLPRQHKAQRDGLALLTATMLDVRSANLMDLAASLPRAAERLDMRYQWISRLLGNRLIEVDAVMAPYAREVLARLAADGRTVVLMIDQTRATERHQVVMVAARVGGRALPLAWRGKAAEGAVGLPQQREGLGGGGRPPPPGGRGGALCGPVYAGRPPPAVGVAGQGDRGRDRLPRAARGAGGGGPPAARWGTAGAHGRPILRDARPDRLVPRPGLGLAAAAEAGPAGVRSRRRDHARRVPGARRLPAERHRAHGEARRDQRRHGARTGPSRALDHRDVGAADRPPRLRLWPQVGNRGDVLRLQDPRLRPGGQPPPALRAVGPADPRHGAGAVLGGLHRYVGHGPWRHARRKKVPDRQPRNLRRGLTSLFRRGIRRLQACLQRLLAPPPLWAAWLN